MILITTVLLAVILYLTKMDFWAVNILVPSLVTGLVIAVIYFAVYVRVFNNFQRQTPNINLHPNLGWVSTYSFIIFIGIGGVVIFAEGIMLDNVFFEAIFIVIVIAVYIFSLIRTMRGGYTGLYFDNNGVNLKLFAARDIYISWKECVDMGVGLQTTPRLYFSKDQLSDKQIKTISHLKLSDRLIWYGYTKEAFEDALKHVDRSKFRNVEILDKDNVK